MKISHILLLTLLLGACGVPVAEQPVITLTPDVGALSTQAVATVYSSLTLTPVEPVDTATAIPTLPPLQSSFIDKFDVAMVLVPAGSFLMGRDLTAGGQPYIEATIGGFYVDMVEVTNLRYMVCVHAGACAAPDHQSSYTHASYYLNPAFANYPVLISSVFPKKADDYCAWRGMHLLTDIEWEKAMRGTDGRSYPWGNTPPDGTRANLCDINCFQSQANKSINDGYTDVAPVGSFPAGASPYGVMDMVGNVNEMVAVSPQTYQAGPHYKSIGAAYDTPTDKTLDAMYNFDDSNPLNTGFRCASDPVGEAVTPIFRQLRLTETPIPAAAQSFLSAKRW